MNPQLPVAGDQLPTPSPSEEIPSEYAIYFPDKHPSLFVSFLGSGHQGAALLVRSTVDGNLYVRKRKRTSFHHERDNETKNALPHPNIPKLHSKTMMSKVSRPRTWNGKEGQTSPDPGTADLWSFANGRDLGHLVKASAASGGLPAIVIYHLMKSLLETAVFIHNNEIAHGDLIPDNIFVDFPETPSVDENTSPTEAIISALPTFLFGDFGSSFRLPPSERMQSHRKIHDTKTAVYSDLHAIMKSVAFALNGGDHGSVHLNMMVYARLNEFNPQLLKAFELLQALPDRLRQFGVSRSRDGEMFERIVGGFLRDLQQAIEYEAQNGILGAQPGESSSANNINKGKERADDRDLLTRLQSLRPRVKNEDREVFAFPGREWLVDMPMNPPGPWCIAEVEKGTWKVRSVDLSNKFCADQVMVTSENSMGYVEEVGYRDVIGLPHY